MLPAATATDLWGRMRGRASYLRGSHFFGNCDSIVLGHAAVSRPGMLHVAKSSGRHATILDAARWGKRSVQS
jgi:hypothetical protein